MFVSVCAAVNDLIYIKKFYLITQFSEWPLVSCLQQLLWCCSRKWAPK